MNNVYLIQMFHLIAHCHFNSHLPNFALIVRIIINFYKGELVCFECDLL